MEDQAIKDVPKTQKEYKRQKGPVPMAAILLCVGFVVVYMLYYGPALLGSFFE